MKHVFAPAFDRAAVRHDHGRVCGRSAARVAANSGSPRRPRRREGVGGCRIWPLPWRWGIMDNRTVRLRDERTRNHIAHLGTNTALNPWWAPDCTRHSVYRSIFQATGRTMANCIRVHRATASGRWDSFLDWIVWKDKRCDKAVPANLPLGDLFGSPVAGANTRRWTIGGTQARPNDRLVLRRDRQLPLPPAAGRA